jgi:coenzyme F420 hydrogenase subunit delta
MIEHIHTKPCLVFGCGNPLFGDDGFGPAVIEHLEAHHTIPDYAACMDTGTCIRDILFDILLSENRPRQIIVIDAAEKEGKQPGEIFEISVDDIDSKKTSDFSLHQFPTTNMLKELKEQTNVDVRVLVAQIQHIPEEINPGISETVMSAVPEMCCRVIDIISKENAYKETA